MVLKEYQRRTLDSVRDWLVTLAEQRARWVRLRETEPDMAEDFDFAVSAAKKVGFSGGYVPRRSGLREPLPCACLKVPTGGGKTLLATKVVELAQTHYRKRQTGLVLWIVPSTQIYRQTYGALKDRDHPYRQMLDNASAGRTLILEKTSGFSPADVEEHLCVLLLMLPSANRTTKETLKMFQDSGGFDRFFPPEDDPAAHAALRQRVPNLDTFEKDDGFWGRQIKTSLGNTLRLLQPLVILDEGHKAYSAGARATLEGFNPCLLIELSATPPKESNVLVEISGQDLLREGMIKLDVHLQNRGSTNWKDTLLAAMERRNQLEERAREHEANTDVHIRPICLIQVERTGKEQRSAGKVHAEDVREHLIGVHGIAPEWIAIKSSEKDELKEVDDAGGLLARDCPIRYIITKQALQEGWDCSFAYVLAILANPSSKTALTQLVGRILRQPFAKKTEVVELNESYVFCYQRRGQSLLDEVRKGFAAEGLGDLRDRIREDAPHAAGRGDAVAELGPRAKFASAVRDIVLPAFLIRDLDEWRPAHYEADILSRVAWDEVDVSPLADLPLLDVRDKDVELRAGLDEKILGEDERPAVVLARSRAGALDYAHVAGHILDTMPNPWRGQALAEQVFETLLKKNPRERVVANYVFIIEELRKRLEEERDRLAETVFRDLLKRDVMRFMLVAEDLGLNRLPKKIVRRSGEKKATRVSGDQFEFDLFGHVAADDLNPLEQQVATYLDEQERMFFWHRNRARRDYAVQGWKRGRIFADFIFTTLPESGPEEFNRVFVVETKGLHLKSYADTDYKRAVFEVCNKHAQKREWSEFVPTMRSKVMRFEVVDEDEWQKRINRLLAS